MSNPAAHTNQNAATGLAQEAVQRRLKKRHAAERRFQLYGLGAIAVSVLSLLILLTSIFSEASAAFTRYYLTMDLPLAEDVIDPSGTSDPETIASNVSGFNQLVQANLRDTVPAASESRPLRRQLYALVPRLGVLPLARQVSERQGLIGTRTTFNIVVSDDLDLYLKGRVSDRKTLADLAKTAGIELLNEGRYRLSPPPGGSFSQLQARLDSESPASVLLSAGETWFRLEDATPGLLDVRHLGGPELSGDLGDPIALDALLLFTPETDRTLSDHQIAWASLLQEKGRIIRRLNWSLLTHSDSTYPELAGAAAAIVGSIFTMLVTALFAIPVGIMAAIYLEEFAAKNRLTSLIEVNINNLAAVPSIVFGLLGAALFLDTFGMARSVPLVGGLVLGLLVLPTVIIASRTALRAVPPSIRTAALGLGASRTQTVFHHTLPLAAPGILTGAIIAMARALGETAPLLLIGMVAFVNEVPTGPNDEATVLPVLIFKWFSGAERAWEPMTSAVIIILLILLIVMNLTAVLLRRRFERRW